MFLLFLLFKVIDFLNFLIGMIKVKFCLYCFLCFVFCFVCYGDGRFVLCLCGLKFLKGLGLILEIIGKIIIIIVVIGWWIVIIGCVVFVIYLNIVIDCGIVFFFVEYLLCFFWILKGFVCLVR